MASCFDTLPTILVVLPIALGPIMSVDVQKRFDIYIRLSLPMFSVTIGEDAYEFLIDNQERLYKLGLVESHGVSYVVY